MKLRLPKGLRAALLACVALASIGVTKADPSIISINFATGNDVCVKPEAGGSVGGVSASGWMNILGDTASAISKTYTALTDQSGAAVSGFITLKTQQNPWSPSGNRPYTTLSDQIQRSYLDLGANNTWTINLLTPQDTDVCVISDLVLYFSGDGKKFSPVSVNGISYVGGVNTLAGEDVTDWGNRDMSVSGAYGNDAINELNTIKVTGLSGYISTGNVSQNNSDKRATLAGMQIILDDTEQLFYSSDLAHVTSESASNLTWKKDGVTSALADIETSARYLNFANGADATTVTFSDEKVRVIEVSSGSLTLAGALSAETLFAKKDTVLNLAGKVSENGNLSVGGQGVVNFKSSTSFKDLILYGAGEKVFSADVTVDGAFYAVGTTVRLESGVTLDASKMSFDRTRTETNLASVSGDGLLKLRLGNGNANDNELITSNTTSAININTNVTFVGEGELSLVGTLRSEDTLNINAGKSLTIANEKGALRVKRSTLNVNGSLNAYYIQLGHETAGNHPGVINLYEGGSLKATKIEFCNAGSGNDSVFMMGGGVLEFTQGDSSAFSYTVSETGDVAKGIVKLHGGTLKADSSSWFIDTTKTVEIDGVTVEKATDKTVEIGGVTVETAEGKTITLRNAKLVGNISTSGNLVLGGTFTGSGSLSVLTGGNLTVGGKVTLGATIENAGVFTLDTAKGGELRFTSRDDLTPNEDVAYFDSLASDTGNGYSFGSYYIVRTIQQEGAPAPETNGITEVYLGNETDPRTVGKTVSGAITIQKDEVMTLGGDYYIVSGGDFEYTATPPEYVGPKSNSAGNKDTTGLVIAAMKSESVTVDGTTTNKMVLDPSVGTKLVLKTKLNEAATKKGGGNGIVVRTNATIQLDVTTNTDNTVTYIELDKVTIDPTKDAAGNVTFTPTLTLRGNGTYTMDQATGIDATATKVGTATTDYPAWTGKIVVSNTELGGNGDDKFYITALNNLGSNIEISGLSGYACGFIETTDAESGEKITTVSKDQKVTAALKLSGTALTLSDAPDEKLTGGTLTLSGNLSGEGSIVNDSTGNVSLGGDISDWKGSYKATDKNTLLIFDGSTAQTLKATVGGGSLEVVTGSLTDNNGQPVNSLTVNSSLTLDKTITITKGGTLAFGTGGSLSFNSLADLTAKGEVTYTDGGAVGNGYRTGTFYVVKGGTTKKESLETVNIDKYTYSQKDGTLVWDTDGVVIKSIEQPGLYYVRQDEVDYGHDNNLAASDNTKGLVLQGGTLNMYSSLNEKAEKGIIVDGEASILLCEGGSLEDVALTVEKKDGVQLKLQSSDGGSVTLKQLTGEGKLVEGSDVVVKESGSFTGTYSGAVRFGTADASATQILLSDANLTVIGKAGTVSLTGLDNSAADDNKLGGIDTKGETVLLNNVRDDVAADGTTTKVPTKVTLVNASRMEKGVLDFTVSAEAVNGSLNSADKPVVTTGAALSLKDVTLKVHEVQNEGLNLTTGGQEKDIVLFVVNDTPNDCEVDNVTVNMDDCPWMTKYFTNFRVVEGSVNVIGDANTGRYAAHGQTPNGTAGLALAGKAMFRLDPQTKNPDSELAQVLDMLDTHLEAGNKGAMDKLGAALAGSSLSAVGMAVSDDVQRQLRSIRNRTTTMGVNECVVNEDMPYVNGWISGDGNYRQLSESGTDAGYQVSSWGGTVGVDVDVNPNLTLGVAVSALFGDYTGKAADTLTGDLDTQYVSLFARVSTGSWVNTFVGTLGRADVDLERTLPGIAGKTTYKTNGMMFGFLYEVARTFALNEDASTCVQPLFNMSFTHTSLDSATEGGAADTRLTTDSASLTQFSLGLGGRLQSIVGENEYNRASIFEARALLKLDFGDRYNKLNTALAALPSATVTTRSNESGVVGAEVGASLTIPLSQDAGSVFFDVNADFRADQTGVNGSVGYRINF